MKIFFNEKSLLLTTQKLAKKTTKHTQRVKYSGKKSLFNRIEKLQKDSGLKKMTLVVDDIAACFAELQSRYKLIEAAGGLIKNKSGKYLIIYRNGKWDLPKGKIDDGESVKDAAIREVKEECGIKNVTIVSGLAITYHVYTQKEQQIVKKTYWFNMQSNDTILVPQLEEGITAIAWKNKAAVKIAFRNSYPALKELLRIAAF
jgi:8-oxo-dGTP pyrophosphatase MutT (NUDIX family)